MEQEGWRGDREEEGQQGGGALLPGFLGGVKDKWVSRSASLSPHGLQVRVKDCTSSWAGNIQSHGEVRHAADQRLSSQSAHSLSFFQGKAESQGPFGWPRPWSNAQVFPAWLSYLRSQLGLAGNFLS